MLNRPCASGVALFASLLFAQSDRGTITGTISDPAGAIVAGAPAQVKNVDTAALFQVGSSATGNYVVELPTGTYTLTVSVPGFKTYVRQGLAVPVAQTLRVTQGDSRLRTEGDGLRGTD